MEAMVGSTRTNLIPGSVQFEYDPDDLTPKITTQMVHKSNIKTCV